MADESKKNQPNLLENLQSPQADSPSQIGPLILKLIGQASPQEATLVQLLGTAVGAGDFFDPAGAQKRQELELKKQQLAQRQQLLGQFVPQQQQQTFQSLSAAGLKPRESLNVIQKQADRQRKAQENAEAEAEEQTFLQDVGPSFEKFSARVLDPAERKLVRRTFEQGKFRQAFIGAQKAVDRQSSSERRAISEAERALKIAQKGFKDVPLAKQAFDFQKRLTQSSKTVAELLAMSNKKFAGELGLTRGEAVAAKNNLRRASQQLTTGGFLGIGAQEPTKEQVIDAIPSIIATPEALREQQEVEAGRARIQQQRERLRPTPEAAKPAAKSPKFSQEELEEEARRRGLR